MFWIIVLIILGFLLYFAELVLLPGITIAAVGAFCSLVGAVVWAFLEYDQAIAFWVLGVVLFGSGLITVFFLRPKTWNRVALKTEIKESVSPAVDSRFNVGDRGHALTRLAPMGNVMINDVVVEAKLRSGYVDQGCAIEVIGFDNHNVIVRSV